MSDQIRAEIKAAAKALCHYPSGPHAANSCCSGIGRCEMKSAIAEITRLRAELATARRDALAEIKQDTDELIEQGRQDGMEQAAQRCELPCIGNDMNAYGKYFAAAIRADSGEGKP